MFSEFKSIANILVLDTLYKYLRSQNNKLFYLFNDQLDYILAYYFTKSETTKRNIDRFFINLLMKLITKKLLYRNRDK